MLCRVSDVTSGKISIGGENIKNVNLYDLRSTIGYVPQESFLFSDSIFNNIAFGKQKCTEDEVILAAKKAGIYNNIKQFKNQFKTIIGERGLHFQEVKNKDYLLQEHLSENLKLCY